MLAGMAAVITVAQQKGGSGKTTIAANLAAAFARSRRVALLDTDPQRSLTRWHDIRAARPTPPSLEITASAVSSWRVQAELDRLRREFDLVIIDSPPQVDQDARRAIRAANLILIPVQPSAPDLWAAEGTLTLAKEERRPAHLVLNRTAPGRRAAEAVRAMLRAVKLEALACGLGNRAAFAKAFAAGLSAAEYTPRSAAATELQALADEIEALLDAGPAG